MRGIRNLRVLVAGITLPAEEKKRTMIAQVRAVAPVRTFPTRPIDIGVWDPSGRYWFNSLNHCDIDGAKVHVFVNEYAPRVMYT